MFWTLGCVPPANLVSVDHRDTFAEYQETAEAAAETYGVPVSLFFALISTESRWKPDARSPAGARGLAQIMPSTAARRLEQLGLASNEPWYEPLWNLMLGAYGLSRYLDRWDGDARFALASYNAGVGKVTRLLEDFEGREFEWSEFAVTLPKQTQAYVRNTLRRRDQWNKAADACKRDPAGWTPPKPRPRPTNPGSDEPTQASTGGGGGIVLGLLLAAVVLTRR